MRLFLKSTVVAVALLAGLACPVVMVGQAVSGGQGMTAKGPNGKSGKMGNQNERHPEIRAAIRALERAKMDLQRANHDFGGHREAALKSCDQAISDLRQALAADKK